MSLSANSQICTIDYSQTQTGIYPDTLPTGNVGLPYNTDITLSCLWIQWDTILQIFIFFLFLSRWFELGMQLQICN
jgi:hypothetical protein